MKRRLILGTIGVITMLLAVVTVKADVDGEEGPGGALGTCKAPFSNICFNIYQNGVLIGTAKGVLNV